MDDVLVAWLLLVVGCLLQWAVTGLILRRLGRLEADWRERNE